MHPRVSEVYWWRNVWQQNPGKVSANTPSNRPFVDSMMRVELQWKWTSAWSVLMFFPPETNHLLSVTVGSSRVCTCSRSISHTLKAMTRRFDLCGSLTPRFSTLSLYCRLFSETRSDMTYFGSQVIPLQAQQTDPCSLFYSLVVLFSNKPLTSSW